MIQLRKTTLVKPHHPFNKLVDKALRRTARKVHKEAAQKGIRLVVAQGKS